MSQYLSEQYVLVKREYTAELSAHHMQNLPEQRGDKKTRLFLQITVQVFYFAYSKEKKLLGENVMYPYILSINIRYVHTAKHPSQIYTV